MWSFSMPTQIKSRGNAWLARVVIDGKEVDSKLFPPGRKQGPEWLAARQWEVERKKELLKAVKPGRQTLTGLALLLAWGDAYIAHVEHTMSRKTLVEKQTVMQQFFGFCRSAGVQGIEDVGKPLLIQWLSAIASERGADRANRYRKNLLAAWNWGLDAIEGFPQGTPPLERIKPFRVDKTDRYVPPEEDIIRVLQVATGQDLIMLLTFYYTGARRGEVFRLRWDDVDMQAGRIRLIDHKGGAGRKRVRWLAMHPTLVDALRWWHEARPRKVENVFMRLDHDSALGEPFTCRQKFLAVLCARAGVRPFGFHALRHKAASIAFTAAGLDAAQRLMGHSRATTTDIYVRSAGLYADQRVLVDALGESGIGQAAHALLEEKMPHELAAHEAFCKQGLVNSRLQ